MFLSKNKLRYSLYFIFICLGIVMLFFLVKKLQELYNKVSIICILKNETNICYINAPVQLLFASVKFRNFILNHVKHNDSRIANLAKLFNQMIQHEKLDPLPYYKEIFKDNDQIKFNSSKGKFSQSTFEIVKLYVENFNEPHFFFDFVWHKPILINRNVFIYVNQPNKFLEPLHQRIKNCKKDEPMPEIIIFHLYGDAKCDEIKVPEIITVFPDISYKLQSQMIKTSGKDKITKVPIMHVYSNVKIGQKWYKIDDSHYEEIEDVNEKVFRNNETTFLIYER
ncbi:putative Peptidase C19, ubiquitin carboxyl-terminal hydrolase 2 protein [Pseudoloma neurophilia]|uniref:Putative Peptidase C19, ubiquitin carboxyl-terminal hydrolase 2 protein n=1 Tax=Pseudoloma neurophilia TaxID=146866 RepID=A0A0R0LZI7_9MICR|nr:putative Peptidase C19, ubiquitin carboxyl-terminal hydrolase 2 protein [Pseudoloma neurophilia]